MIKDLLVSKFSLEFSEFSISELLHLLIYLLSTHYVPGTVLGMKPTVVNPTDTSNGLVDLKF